jgi:CheY-like chemotaxis protein
MFPESRNTHIPATDLSRRRTRVVIVEDDQTVASGLRRVLSLNGYEVRVAYSGPEGVGMAREWPPEVVLCDIGLPGLDGYGVATALRQDPATAQARLIAVTGCASDDARRRSEEVGFERLLVKPVDAEVLLGLLGSP